MEAITPLKLSLKLDPLNPEVWCNLGLAYYSAEDFVRAESSFRFTIALDSKHSPGYQNLGNTLISVLRAEEAIEILEKGLELDKTSTHCLWNLSLAYLLLGRFKEGWRYYEARFGCPDFNGVNPRLQVLLLGVLMKHQEWVKSLWLFGVSRGLVMPFNFADISICLMRHPFHLYS